MKEEKKEWWKKPVRVLQFNIEDRYGVHVSSITGKELVRLAKEINANVLVIFARDPWGRTYYNNSSVGPKHPKVSEDLIEEAVKEGRRQGVKVVVMVGHTANKYLYSIHSDWAQVNKKGEIILLEHVPYGAKSYEPEWPQMCINSPFIDYIAKEVKEVMEKNVDGVFLDSFRYQPDIERACYCKWCRTRFKQEHGYDMPLEPKWGDSRWYELWEWRYRVVVEKLKQLHGLTKKINPQTLFMYNSHPGGWAGRTNKVVELARDYIDVVFAECSEADHQPPGFISEMVKVTKAMFGGKPVWASRNYFHLYRTVSPTTPLAIKQGLREAIIAGGSPWLLIFSISYKQDPSVIKAAKEVFKEHELLEEYLVDAEPLRYVAIVVSNTTRDHYGRDHPEHYVDEIRGFYYALVHSHIPVEFIAERDLSDISLLSRYHVVVLANTVCMSNNQTSVIEDYVKSGGKIIATYMTSTRDDKCIRRYEFGLSRVLGVELRGVFRQPWSYVVIARRDHTIFHNIDKRYILWGDMSYEFLRKRVSPMLGWHALTRSMASSEELAYIGLAGGIWGYEYTLGRSPPPYIASINSPAIVVNRYGEGESLYFSGQLGRHYWRTGLTEYLYLIRNSIRYLSGRPKVEVEAPETVASEIYTQGDRIVIHLLNHTYNQRILSIGIGKIKQPLPPYSASEAVHPPREVILIRNIVVKVHGIDSRQYRAYLPLRNKELNVEAVGEGSRILLDSLHEYEVLVIEPRS